MLVCSSSGPNIAATPVCDFINILLDFHNIFKKDQTFQCQLDFSVLITVDNVKYYSGQREVYLSHITNAFKAFHCSPLNQNVINE